MQYFPDVILYLFFLFFDGKSRFKRHLSGKILRRSLTINFIGQFGLILKYPSKETFIKISQLIIDLPLCV